MLVARAGQALKGPRLKLAHRQEFRSINMHARIPSLNGLAHRGRTYIARFIAHFQVPLVPRFSNYHSSIPQSLSLPTRIALSRPFGAPHLPKAPRIPGHVAHVGLGTARNFSTAQPIFRHIVENVPVAGRAFYEMDWDVKLRKEKDIKVHRPKRSTRRHKSADKLKINATLAHAVRELDHYFPTVVSVPLTTTYLQIPLAPTPTSRVPLSAEPSPRLLPIPHLIKEHCSHSTHSIKVSSIFRRLDAARVWEKGASCDVYGDPTGRCTVLRVKFEGWTENMVKGILGHAGNGWCTIQEIRHEEFHTTSPASIPCRNLSPEPFTNTHNERINFVMPSIDLSAISSSPIIKPDTSGYSSSDEANTSYSYSSPPQSVWEEDGVSDCSSLKSCSFIDECPSTSTKTLLGFSSDFADKASSFN